MVLKHLVVSAALVLGSAAACAAQVPPTPYHGLHDSQFGTPARPAVWVAHPGHFQRSDERHGDDRHHRGDDHRHRDSESGGYGS